MAVFLGFSLMNRILWNYFASFENCRKLISLSHGCHGYPANSTQCVCLGSPHPQPGDNFIHITKKHAASIPHTTIIL